MRPNDTADFGRYCMFRNTLCRLGLFPIITEFEVIHAEIRFIDIFWSKYGNRTNK